MIKKIALLFISLIFPSLCAFAQEPRQSSFDDFVFKTPVAYKTDYTNETNRILEISDWGPFTAVRMSDKVRILADSADVYIHPYEFLCDPVTGKRYHLVNSENLPKFRGIKYLKRKNGMPTNYDIEYTLLFDRVPQDVKMVEFHHNPRWENFDKYYSSKTFFDIDMTKRKVYAEDKYQWVNLEPKSDKIKYYTPLGLAKDAEPENGKSHLFLNLAFRNVEANSQYGSISFWLNNNFSLVDQSKNRTYKSGAVFGFPLGKDNFQYIQGYDIMAFGVIIEDVDSDVEVVDVYAGNTCIIKGLHLKP